SSTPISTLSLHDALPILTAEEAKLQAWLDKGFHGEMAYMATHGMMRARPQELHPGTVRVISVRMDYLPPEAGFATNLTDPNLGRSEEHTSELQSRENLVC